MKLNHDYQRNNILNSGLSDKFAYPLSRMLKTALNDASEDRKLELSILQLFNQNPIFDEYLATNENFEKLLYIYNDDNLKVKIEVVKTIGRMGYVNQARAIPELRKMLVDIKNKLEHSGNSKDKCDVARLISALACEVPDILKTNLPLPIPDIMNILYQNLVEQYDKETSLNNEIENIDNLEAEVENDENVGRKNSFNRKRAISRTQGELEPGANLTMKGRTTSKGRINVDVSASEFERKGEDDVFEDEDNEIHEIIKMSTKSIRVQTIYLQCLSDLIDLAPVEIELYRRFVELFLGKAKHGTKDNKDGYLRADASHATNKEDSKRRVYTLKCLCKLHQSPITTVPRGYGQKRQFTAYFVGLRTYVEYPHFQERIFDLLRQTMFQNELPQVRVLAVKTLGILGALDPDQYRRIQYATKQKLHESNKAAILAGTDLGQSSIDPADETEADMTRFYGQPSTHMLVDEGMNNLAGKNHNKMDLTPMINPQSEENEVPRPPPIEIRDLKSCIHILSRDLEDKSIDYQITILETITKLIEQASGFGGSQTKQSNRPFKNYKDMVQDQVKIVIPKMLEIIPQIAKKDFTKVHDVMVNIRKICEYLNKFIQDYVEDILKTVDQLWTAVYNYQQNSNFGNHYSHLHRNRRENNSLIFGTNIDRSLVLKEQYKLIIELINISAVVAKVRDVHFRQHIKVIITHMQRAFKGGELESNVEFRDLEHDEWQGFQKLMKEGKLVINNKERSQNWKDTPTSLACSAFGVIITILMRTRDIFGKCVREFIRMILEAILDLIAMDCQQIREQALKTLRELIVRENLQKYMKPVSNSLVKLNVRQVKLKKELSLKAENLKQESQGHPEIQKLVKQSKASEELAKEACDVLACFVKQVGISYRDCESRNTKELENHGIVSDEYKAVMNELHGNGMFGFSPEIVYSQDNQALIDFGKSAEESNTDNPESNSLTRDAGRSQDLNRGQEFTDGKKIDIIEERLREFLSTKGLINVTEIWSKLVALFNSQSKNSGNDYYAHINRSLKDKLPEQVQKKIDENLFFPAFWSMWCTKTEEELQKADKSMISFPEQWDPTERERLIRGQMDANTGRFNRIENPDSQLVKMTKIVGNHPRPQPVVEGDSVWHDVVREALQEFLTDKKVPSKIVLYRVAMSKIYFDCLCACSGHFRHHTDFSFLSHFSTIDN